MVMAYDTPGAGYGSMPAYAAQGYGPQFAPQGWLGNLLGGVGAPVGGAIGGILGNQQFGNHLGGMAGGLARRYLPFDVDPMAAYGYVQAGGQVAPQTILLAQNALDPEAQAFTDFLKTVTASVIARLSDYLRTNVGQHPALSDCIPLVTRATELWNAHDYTRSFAQLYQVYRSIAIVRSRMPNVPGPDL
jgi:hypothetical protein